MAFSVSPSVIVREVDASAAVPAIATPPAAIAGVFRWGPVGETVLVSSENELANRFGKPDDTNYETFFTAADYLSYSSALWVARVDNGAVAADSTDIVLYDANTAPSNNDIGEVDPSESTFGAFEALYPGSLGNEIDVSYVKGANFSQELAAVGDFIDTLSFSGTLGLWDDTLDYNSTTLKFLVAAADQLPAVVVGDLIEIGNDSVGYQTITVTSITEVAYTNVGNLEANTAAAAYFTYDIGLASSYRLFETAPSKIKITKKWKNSSTFAGKAPSTDNYNIVVIDRNGNITGEAGTPIEIYENLSTSSSASLADGSTNYYVDVIANNSSWIKVANTAALSATSGYEVMSGGTDGTSETAVALSALADGYDFFANANEIDVSFILQGKGDDAGTRANYIISNIVDNRKDAVAFLSPSKEAAVDENRTNAKLSKIIAYRNKLQNSSYWFMDSGYKYRYDKYNDVYRWVPLNGDMAGLASRVEPYESPAGFRKGVIKNVVKLAFNPNKAQRDQLYSSDINPVMSQVGQGIVLFGDKTGLGQVSAFDRINVRRLFIAVEKAIANAAQSFLFEFNDEFSQTQFRNIVEPFLREIQGRRGIIDFRVVSDSTVNTPTIVDQNKFVANIFIKPARSINVIELTFVATRTGIEFEEIVGSIA